MANEIDLKRILKSIDLRDFDFYSNLTEDEKKSFNPFILMRFVSNVKGGGPDVEEWFIASLNKYVNKHYLDLGKEHKELIWKLFAACGIGQPFYHPYLAASKKKKIDKFEKLLAETYPNKKLDDIRVLASLMSKSERDEFLDNMGIDKKQRKNYE